MLKTYTYDPEKVVASIGSMFLTGFADDTMIEVEKNEDDTLVKVGLDGHVSYTENLDKTATVKISLMSTSPCIPYIRELANNKREFPFSMVDMNDNGTNVACDRCRIVKKPNIVVKKEAESVEFEVFVPEWK
ncbi:phage structural protein [uncultured Anaerococcus sp.]|uniref:phage structural protein n=1 Tax=uncultured Anaerococcus sp. TaxID=293428 RepID=UPI0025E43046|nr:hypothetical protein [uncultured Anaerococcus sp.]